MNNRNNAWDLGRRTVAALTVVAASSGVVGLAQDVSQHKVLSPGNLVVSRSVYDNQASNVQVGMVLPPNCTSTTGGCSAATGAPFDGTYPNVWNNDAYDGSFGITAPIFLDQISIFGQPINSIEVPNSLMPGIRTKRDQLVTSFSSKSELALNLPSRRIARVVMGYVAPVERSTFRTRIHLAHRSDKSGRGSYERAVATVDARGKSLSRRPTRIAATTAAQHFEQHQRRQCLLHRG